MKTRSITSSSKPPKRTIQQLDEALRNGGAGSFIAVSKEELDLIRKRDMTQAKQETLNASATGLIEAHLPYLEDISRYLAEQQGKVLAMTQDMEALCNRIAGTQPQSSLETDPHARPEPACAMEHLSLSRTTFEDSVNALAQSIIRLQDLNLA